MENDRKEYSMGRQLAFVDVDTQFDFMDPQGKLYVPGAEKLIPNLQRLTEWACRRSVPIVASADCHPADDPEFGQFPPHCVAGTPGQKKIPETLGRRVLMVENRPLEPWPPMRLNASILPYDQILLLKQCFSLFGNANADTLFRKLSARRYVVYGVATDYCVKAAVLGLRSRGCRVEVVEDAIAPVDPKTGDLALAEMRAAGAELTDTETVLSGALA